MRSISVHRSRNSERNGAMQDEDEALTSWQHSMERNDIEHHPVARYSSVAQALHWATAVLVLIALIAAVLTFRIRLLS